MGTNRLSVTFPKEFVKENKDLWPFNHLKCTRTSFIGLEYVLLHSDHAPGRTGLHETFTIFQGFSVNPVKLIPPELRCGMLMDGVTIRIVPPTLARLVSMVFYAGNHSKCWVWMQTCLQSLWLLLTPRHPKSVTKFSYHQSTSYDYLFAKYLKFLAEYYVTSYVPLENRGFTWMKWRLHCKNSFWGGKRRQVFDNHKNWLVCEVTGMHRYQRDVESNREDREECLTLSLGPPVMFLNEDLQKQKEMLPRVSTLPDTASLPCGMFANCTPGNWPVTPESEALSDKSNSEDGVSSHRLSRWAYAQIPTELEFVTSSFED